MKLISHRGNLTGPNKELENNPTYIINAINSGYDVEIDAWLDKDQNIYLGHDEPLYLIKKDFIKNNISRLWIHCKNIEMLYMLCTKIPESNFFWHENDKFTLTSKNIIWTYPGKEVTPVSVMVYLDPVPDGWETDDGMYGICSDYIGRVKPKNGE